MITTLSLAGNGVGNVALLNPHPASVISIEVVMTRALAEIVEYRPNAVGRFTLLRNEPVSPDAATSLIPILLARWEAQADLGIALEEAVRAELTFKLQPDDIEFLVEQQIATEQASYLVEFFWLLEASGCASPERMQVCIDQHNAQTAQMWTELLLEKAIRTTKLLMGDVRLLQQQQDELVAELLRYLRKARSRIAIPSYSTALAGCLKNIDTADAMLRELVASKRSNAHSSQQCTTLLRQLEMRWWCLPSGPRRRRRLERVLGEAYFGPQAKNACTARLNGTRVVLSSSDIERFMAFHMDSKLCRDRLDALATGGLLESKLWSDDQSPSVRLFRSTDSSGLPSFLSSSVFEHG
jgi:hypothetical protein